MKDIKVERDYTPRQRKHICRLYQKGLAGAAIANVFHTRASTIYSILRKEGVHIYDAHILPKYVPTPEDIKSRAAAIREGWNAKEMKRRDGSFGQEGWTPPTVIVPPSLRGRESA